jgi:ureidoglycolate lyase
MARLRNMQLLKPVPLTAEAFAPFGDVIQCASTAERRQINYGHTERFHNLAALDVQKDAGIPLVSIFRSRPMERPIPVKVMERHPLSSQAFYPLDKRPYLVLVAPRGDFDAEKMQAFVAAGDQGVNYHAGVWHHFSLALNDVSDFLVIDRGGPEKNCDEVFLENVSVFIDY